MREKSAEAAKPEAVSLEDIASMAESKLIDGSCISDEDTCCMACGNAEGAITKVDDSVALMLRKGPDSIFSGYDKIYMHEGCRDELITNLQRQEEMRSIARDAHRIALHGTYAERLALIENCPMALEERDSNNVPIACTLALEGSEEVLMKLIGMGIGVLRIGDDRMNVFGSVACIIAGGKI